MPALPSVPNVASIVLRHTLGTDANIINRLHSRFTGVSTEAELNGWALGIANSWVTDLAPHFCTDLVLNEVVVTDLTSSSSATGSNISNHPGGNGTVGVPANGAMVMQFQINRRYKGGRPKQYLAGLAQNAMIDEDHWSTTIINSMEASYTLFAAAVGQFVSGALTGAGIVNVSYVAGHTWEQDQRGNWHRMPVYRPTPVLDVVNGYTVNPIIGSQRRRARA